jgi:hypothetical protein
LPVHILPSSLLPSNHYGLSSHREIFSRLWGFKSWKGEFFVPYNEVWKAMEFKWTAVDKWDTFRINTYFAVSQGLAHINHVRVPHIVCLHCTNTCARNLCRIVLIDGWNVWEEYHFLEAPGIRPIVLLIIVLCEWGL